MATTKTLKPTNTTITIPAFQGEKPDARVLTDAEGKLADAINAIASISSTQTAHGSVTFTIKAAKHGLIFFANNMVGFIKFSIGQNVYVIGSMPSGFTLTDNDDMTLTLSRSNGNDFAFTLVQFGVG